MITGMLTELTYRRIYLAALQETHLLGIGTINEASYTFFWFDSQTLSSPKVNTKQGVMYIVNAYTRTLAATANDKECFYNLLGDTIQNSAKSHRIVLPDDLNARIGADHASRLDY